MKKALFIAITCVSCFNGFTQNDLINRLEKVIIRSDRKLRQHSVGYKVSTLKDSVLHKNTESFTLLLRYNSPIYFKEYGAGGTSTASFRGTSASNTAVIWNGVNVNSINNGQTGFNSLTVSLFDAIDVRSGGGSIEYGSGAIGGTIHLNDNLKFTSKRQTENLIVVSVGSFNTYNSLYKFRLSDSKKTVKIGLSYNQSENDYKFLDTDFKNTNGAYENLGVNISLAFFINRYSKLKFYSANYFAERFLSGELPNPLAANDKYKDFNHRNLLVYNLKKSRLQHELKLGYLAEEYQYFEDKAISTFNFGKSKRYLANYNLGYSFLDKKGELASYTEYESILGKTDQILEKRRTQFSQSIIYNQKIGHAISFETKIRKDFNSDYKVPFTYALGIKVKTSNCISIRANGSRNYRVPTYNDLYWPGQGNLDLIPETSLQGELGVIYNNNQFKIDLGAFYIAVKDKIVWIPNGDSARAGVWVPINLSRANNKGLELAFSYKEKVNKHIFSANLNYSYTIAENEVTNKQAIFVPEHLLNGNVTYNYRQLSFFYQHLFNGKVYTTESNSKDFVVPSFFVSNVGVDYKLFKNTKTQFNIGLKVNNVFNENYVVIPRRPMPNRNFNLNINYKF
ncbi:TonB-dependent receptor [Flavivirga aquatica]|uniref:TonB-dependent receptor n=1 Tax=Flavivirga aquatica TaxID=1849968 RepID=A0A1E5TBF0_9FLAO|nr:TonB-dependent receptor [Flavivirga aquatica]OEK08713.1 TonB-dependent receptor [Flavivirga aquatica]